MKNIILLSTHIDIYILLVVKFIFKKMDDDFFLFETKKPFHFSIQIHKTKIHINLSIIKI